MGNVRVWIQDLWGGGGGKANNLQRILSRSTVPQTVMRERKCTLLHQLRWIPHHADTLRLWREIFSLPNVFSRTQPRHSGLTQGRFLPGVLHSYRLKRRSKHNAKRTRHCGVHLALCTHVAEKLRPHSQTNPQSTLWSREWFQTPVLATGAVGARGSGLSRSRPLWAHCTHTASVKLASSLGHGEAFLFVSTAVPLGFDTYTKWNYILNYKTVPVSGLQKLFSYPFSKVLETRNK